MFFLWKIKSFFHLSGGVLNTMMVVQVSYDSFLGLTKCVWERKFSSNILDDTVTVERYGQARVFLLDANQFCLQENQAKVSKTGQEIISLTAVAKPQNALSPKFTMELPATWASFNSIFIYSY